MLRYLIVGTGAAGISAAETIRSHDPQGEITLVGQEPDGYYSRPGLAYLLSGELPADMLYPFREEDFRKLKLRLVQACALRLAPRRQKVELADGRHLPYDRLLLAVGAVARPPAFPGSDLVGVVQLDSFASTRLILKLSRKARNAVVVGGGITALEIVEGLQARGVHTHYFLRGERYWSKVLDETESRLVERRLTQEGVTIHYHTELVEILGKPAGLFRTHPRRVAGVRTNTGKTLACDLVAVAIGITPRLHLAQEAGLDIDRGVLVNEYLQTSLPNIYAAGDVAQVFDPLSGKALLNSLWGPAKEQGRVAGLNMAGMRASYRKPVSFNVTRLAGLTTTIIGAVGGHEADSDLTGITRGDSETWRQPPDAITAQNNFEINRLRLMVGEKTLLGAVVMGDQTPSQPIHHLIRDQVDISSIRERLLQADAPLGDILGSFWKNHISHAP